ncbi:hypothetical protein BH11MYX1_BH11MYX1_54760 [soil metagenome]
MLRVEVSEEGRPALPSIDVSDPVVVIGSAPSARIRLPAAAARPEHVIIDNAVGTPTWRSSEGSGSIGEDHTFQIAGYRVRVAIAPPGTQPSPPQRTESLARELVRGLLGADAAPSLTVERGPHAGATRSLPPPDAAYVIGRGDDAQWIFDDPDLSKRHLEIRRSWDGTTVLDLGSKNGTRLEGRALPAAREAVELRNEMLLELGGVAIRYRDPAEAHLGAPTSPVATPVASVRTGAVAVPARGRSSVFAIAIVIAICAAAGILWLALG